MKKFLNTLRKDEAGFTLVELMVVVAIIGILAAVAIPNFRSYQAKSRTSDAKLILSALYMAEETFFGDTGTYASCLRDMGFDSPSWSTPTAAAPEGAAITATPTTFYAHGFSAGSTSPGAVGDLVAGVRCRQVNALGQNSFDANRAAGGEIVLSAGLVAANCGDAPAVLAGTGETYMACAVGRVGTADIDSWTINQAKILRHQNTGF